jgi:hemolysin activation/secretion protein
VAVAGSWQYADEKTVPSPLLFEVGGATTVRGYPEGAVAGARAYTAGLEGRYRWRDGLEPYAFLDYGRIEDVSPDSENLSSIGLGVSWRYSDSLSAEIAWGQTLEDALPDQDDGRLHFRLSWSWAS